METATPDAAALPETASAPEATAVRRATVRGFLFGACTGVTVMLLALFVDQAAHRQRATAGKIGNGSAANERDEARLVEALSRDPEGIETRLARARTYVDRQQWMAVWNETAKVLDRSPGEPRALAAQALVRLAMGQGEVAVAQLNKALETKPDMLEAYAWLAVANARMGRTREADAAMARGAKLFPERAAELQRDRARLENAAAVAQASGAGADPHGGVAAATNDAPRGRRVSGTVELDPSRATAQRGVVFVFARAAGASEGPPLAVKRLPPRFPAVFELSEADSMLGQPLPDQLVIEARLDGDGDPSTRSPADPKARLAGVTVGRTDLRLVLK